MLFFLTVDLQVLIPAVFTEIFTPTTEPAIPMGIPTNEAKAEIKKPPAMVKN